MRSVIISAVLGMTLAASSAIAQPAPSPVAGLSYDVPFFPGAIYDANVPTPDAVLGYRLGDKAASPAEIEAYIKAVAAKSNRVKVVEYARSHEGRPLHYLVISSPETIATLDKVKSDIAKFADPRKVSASEGDALAEKLPLVAWMAYCIHGDEMSSSDGALSIIYHLAASKDADVASMLKNMIVIVDPLMNPDGRDRSVALIRQRRTSQPDVDDQSILHTQLWPSGRMNHYLFDMNRDWIFGTQPETRGRIVAAGEWNPQYFMEGHEMGSQDTFLFMPAREPINYNYPEHAHKWGVEIQKDHAAAFDALGWRYYSGEWNESWYPGYSSTWGALRGSIEQLYEMANIHTDAVRRPEGTLVSYRESVHHQIVSSWANLSSLSKNRTAIMKDYLAAKRKNVSADGRFAKRLFAFPPSSNTGRMQRFLDLALVQGFEVFETTGTFKGSGVDRLGASVTDREFPAGTLLISSRQPLGNLVAAMLEFDPRFRDEFLQEERRELLRFGQSRLYDTTAWNIPMLFDIDACELSMDMPAGAKRIEKLTILPTLDVQSPIAKNIAWIANGDDDRTVSLAARLMERGVWVRAAEKPFEFDGVAHARGSIVIVAKDNTLSRAELEAAVTKAAGELAVPVTRVASGLGAGDLPDLGGNHFQLLQQPRVAVLAQSPISPYAYGETWYLLDHTLGMRASSVDFGSLSGMDLRRYNTLIIPDGAGSDDLKPHVESIRAWVEQGGTLIAVESSAHAFTTEGGIGSTRLLPDVLGKLDEYRLAVIRDWEGLSTSPKGESVYARTPPEKVEYPWTMDDGDKASDEELKRRDQWRRIFAPQGAVVAGRVDDRHWLTSGCGEILPVLYGGRTVLMAPTGVQSPIRIGTFVVAPEKPAEAASRDAKVTAKSDDESKDGDKKDGDKKEEPKTPPPGWRIAPKGHEMVLRMSGLLWPEAADRIANSSYVTREGVGNGQIILFASSPTTRAATLGSQRVLSNAIVYGPGLGARATIRP